MAKGTIRGRNTYGTFGHLCSHGRNRAAHRETSEVMSTKQSGSDSSTPEDDSSEPGGDSLAPGIDGSEPEDDGSEAEDDSSEPEDDRSREVAVHLPG